MADRQSAVQEDEPQLTPNAQTVLERRYLVRDDEGRPTEARPYLEDVIASEPGSPLAAEARALLGRP